MGDPEAHIAGWEAAGLIDAATAARLRQAEGQAGGVTRTPAGRPSELSQAAAMLGPSVTIAEVFGYLGTGFLLAGWTAFVTRLSDDQRSGTLGIGAIVAALVLVGLGFLLRRGDQRRRRAAGVAFVVSIAYGAGGVGSLLVAAGVEGQLPAVAGSVAGLGLAAGLRVVHPSVLTHVGVLGALTAVFATVLNLLRVAVVPEPTFDPNAPVAAGPDPMLLLVISAAWWLTCAIVIGLIGLREARTTAGGAGAAARRAGVSRFWAGITAVAGLANAVTQTRVVPDGPAVRVLEPLIGELALVALCVVLLEQAFRRDATSFVYAAAIGLIVAMSDFNFTYLSENRELGLVIEGAILLGVGIVADRLRRRIGRGEPVEPDAGMIAQVS
jgi:hypothetical protein